MLDVRCFPLQACLERPGLALTRVGRRWREAALRELYRQARPAAQLLVAEYLRARFRKLPANIPKRAIKHYCER
jgi:hypothetical protein